MIESRYPVVTFSEILSPIQRRVALSDTTEYGCVGVRLYGRGAFRREIKAGISIKKKKQLLIRTGDVLYNKLFAWKGTFALADDAVDGCIASDKFPTAKVNLNKIRPQYLALWFQTEELALEAKHLSRGAAALSKLTLNPPDFWRLPIPLPSLAEQDKIVSFLKQTMTKIGIVLQSRAPIDAVLQGRRAGIGSDLRLLMSAALSKLSISFQDNLGALDEVLSMRPRSGPSFPCSEKSPGISVIMPSALGGFRFDDTKCLFGNGTEVLHEKDIVQFGDLLIARGNKRDQVGLCVVYEETDRRTYANLLMRMRTNPALARPSFVKYWLMTPIAVDHIRRNTKGTSPSVQKINQKALISTPFPRNVSISKQDEWIKYIDRIFAGVDQLELLARSQFQQIVATRKAILSSTFCGDKYQ